MATMTTSWMQRGRTGGLVALLALACCAEEESPTSGGGCGLTSYSDEFIGSNDPSSSAAICMPRSFAVNAVGHAPCVVIEGRRDDTCTCDGFRRAVPTEHAAIADELANKSASWGLDYDCFCELPQLDDGALAACQEQELESDEAPGWCYVDSSIQPPLGNPDLTAPCPETRKRVIRVVGDAVPAGDRGVILYCEQSESC